MSAVDELQEALTDVAWTYRKSPAAGAVQSLGGIIGVSNRILTKHVAGTASISDEIAHTLDRSWRFDPSIISFTAQRGDIPLTGSVTSWRCRIDVADTAWAAPGTSRIVNDLAVA
jgi:osmotically-inducible protein OsmY